MYVCVCKAVTESHIRIAVAEGCSSMRELRERLGIGACCGRCSSCARNVMREAIVSVPAAKEIHFAMTAA
jgi:bacterioferritin-associated ferredoxin